MTRSRRSRGPDARPEPAFLTPALPSPVSPRLCHCHGRLGPASSSPHSFPPSGCRTSLYTQRGTPLRAPHSPPCRRWDSRARFVAELSPAHPHGLGVPSSPRPAPTRAPRPGCRGLRLHLLAAGGGSRCSRRADQAPPGGPRAAAPRRLPGAAALWSARGARGAIPASRRGPRLPARPRQAPLRVPGRANAHRHRESDPRGRRGDPPSLRMGGDSLPPVDSRGGNSLPGVTGMGAGIPPQEGRGGRGFPRASFWAARTALRVNPLSGCAGFTNLGIPGGKDPGRKWLRNSQQAGLPSRGAT